MILAMTQRIVGRTVGLSRPRRVVAVAAVAAGLAAAATIPALAVGDTASSFGLTDTDAVTAQARTVVGAASLAQVPPDAALTFVLPQIKVVAPTPIPPPPEPEPVVVPQREYAAPAPSRSEARSAPPASVDGNAVLETAAKYQGTPYVYGGSSENGFDCSGLVQQVYGELGISLPHQSEAILSAGTVIPADQAQPGDIIWTPGHVALYAGDGQMIDASSNSGGVDFRPMWQSDPTYVRVN